MKNTYANRPVPRSECSLEVPVFADIPTPLNNAPKGLLQTLSIVCLAPDLRVRRPWGMARTRSNHICPGLRCPA